MNKSIVLTSAFLTIALTQSIASAQSDAQYPAANFEPKVIFIDEAAAANSNKASGQGSTQSHAKKAEVDPQHPAAFFEPKVIFP
jgi:hypothetical protein